MKSQGPRVVRKMSDRLSVNYCPEKEIISVNMCEILQSPRYARFRSVNLSSLRLGNSAEAIECDGSWGVGYDTATKYL